MSRDMKRAQGPPPRPHPLPSPAFIRGRFSSSRQSAAQLSPSGRRGRARIHTRGLFFYPFTGPDSSVLAEMRRLLVVVTAVALLTGAWALRVVRVASFSTWDVTRQRFALHCRKSRASSRERRAERRRGMVSAQFVRIT